MVAGRVIIVVTIIVSLEPGPSVSVGMESAASRSAVGVGRLMAAR
ncbi:MAG: hypothetical protein ACSLFH_14525 [Desulfuromonadales bacterium]